MAQPRYSFEDDPVAAERQPLGSQSPSPSRHQQQHYPTGQNPHQRYPPRQQHYQQGPLPSSPLRGAHPDSAFGRLRAQRRRSQEGPVNGGAAPSPYTTPAIPAGNYRQQPDLVSPASPPQAPPHRGRVPDRAYPTPQRQGGQSTITPGADNFGDAAAGGMAGIALTVAEHNARESGLQAIRGPDYPQQSYQQQGQWANQGQGQAEGRIPGATEYASPRPSYNHLTQQDSDSHSSLQALNASARSPGLATPGQRTPSRSPQHSFGNEVYTDDPYNNLNRHQDPRLGAVDPHAIEDDGDDGIHYHKQKQRNSMLSLGSSHRGAAGGASGLAAGSVAGGFASRNGSNSGLSSQYAPVHNSSNAYEGHGPSGLGVEKSWQPGGEKKRNTKRWKLIIILVVGFIIIAGVVLGVVFGVVLRKNGDGSKSVGQSADADFAANGDLDINSGEIKRLMANPKLHKVFPGVDYTPVNTQYPECIHDPPSQNNVTRDLAVLSQMTNTLRLYGNDCNQTQMVIHAIDKLGLQDSMRLWLGVWQDNNKTTNARQLTQLWDILDKHKDKVSYFKGIVVANEILFREQMTVSELGSLLADVRAKLAVKGIALPVATSDLGDKWTATLASQSDYIMANIHPFFAGTQAKDAAEWTYAFWNNQNSGFFKKDAQGVVDLEKNIISETGWPTEGGQHCGTADEKASCPSPAVAGIPQLNEFMEKWVCQALNNGTNYFWFESFDEPWKWRFNSGDRNWEDHWGLMDVNRNLKTGVEIPDCGGKTIDG